MERASQEDVNPSAIALPAIFVARTRGLVVNLDMLVSAYKGNKNS